MDFPVLMCICLKLLLRCGGKRRSNMKKVKERPARFHVGDWVSFEYGPRRVVAQIVEDHGPIGVNGRRLYDVRLKVSPEAIFTFAMPEGYLEPAVATDKGIGAYLNIRASRRGEGSKKLKPVKESPPRFRVGDWVSLLYGPKRRVAQVVEDRGPFGVNGRRLYGIRLEVGPDYVATPALPEELLDPAEAPNNGTTAPE
jgi:hypothetical protein